jgi:hypothetical protein
MRRKRKQQVADRARDFPVRIMTGYGMFNGGGGERHKFLMSAFRSIPAEKQTSADVG